MCIQKVSYRIGLFIDNDYKSAAKLHNLCEIYLRRWEKNENNLLFFVPNADLPGINHEHRPIATLSIVVSRKGELAQQQFLFLVIKMPFQFQFYTLPGRVVIQVPNAVTEASIHHRPHLVLKPPDSVKVNHRPNLQFQDMRGHVVSRLDKRQQRIAVAGLVDVALRLIALEGQVPCAHVPADGHRLVEG